MNDSIRLGRILGIPIGVNWSIVAVAVAFTFSLGLQALPLFAPETSTRARLIAAAIGVVIFFASILAHELGHALVALAHGISVSGITLWLLGGVAKLDRQAPTARAEFQIAVAGPAVSFALGAFFVSLAIVASALDAATLAVAVLGWLGGVNLVLAVFNLLPAAPLDGGRVLTAALWRRLGDAEQARIISGRCGLVLSLALAAFGAYQLFWQGQFGGWVTALVGAFTFVAARSEIASSVLRKRLLSTTAGQLMTPHPSPIADSTTVAALRAARFDSEAAHPVTRWDASPIGYVVIADAGDGLSEAEQAWTTVAEVMWPASAVPTVERTTSADELLRRWQADKPGLAIVVPSTVGVGAGTSPGAPSGTVTQHQLAPLFAPPDIWGRDRDAREPDGSLDSPERLEPEWMRSPTSSSTGAPAAPSARAWSARWTKQMSP